MMRAKYLLAKLVLAVRTELLGGDLLLLIGNGGHPLLLLLVLAPDGLLVQLARPRLRVHLAYLLHLEALLEVFQLVEVFLLKHLANEEPVQIVLLQAHH